MFLLQDDSINSTIQLLYDFWKNTATTFAMIWCSRNNVVQCWFSRLHGVQVHATGEEAEKKTMPR
jgi:hypothetical protein